MSSSKNDTTAALEEEEESLPGQRRSSPPSLNALYGNKIGILQSLSLILNAGCMLYAHLGLSGVFLSNHARIDEAATSGAASAINNTSTIEPGCTAEDLGFWTSSGALLKPEHQSFCAVQERCFVDPVCNADCFAGVLGYSLGCAQCFAPLPMCNFQAGCTSVCSGSGADRVECEACTVECDDAFHECSGFPRVDWTNRTLPPGVSNGTEIGAAFTTTTSTTSSSTTTDEEDELVQLVEGGDVCGIQQQGVDYTTVEEYYVVYELKFFDAVEAAWTGDARLLAVVVVIFSGIWPYAKNLLLMLAWYLPLSEHRRANLLLWLRRLGKYTLVDVYLVVALLVSVLLEVSIADGSVPLVLRGEPRPAIVAFLVATVWEFFHIEWMTHRHQRKLQGLLPTNDAAREGEEQPQQQQSVDSVLDTVRFKKVPGQEALACRNPVLLKAVVWTWMALSIALFVVGTSIENIRFTSVLANEEDGCVRGYNLYSFGATMVTDLALHLNNAKGMVWILMLSFFVLLVVLPLFVHSVQILVLVFKIQDKRLCLLADAVWTFASVDVYLLALFVVQYKFSEMIETLAGEDGSDFFTIRSELGPGFYVLVAYSVLAGLFQWFFNCAVAGYHPVDVVDRRVPVWGVACCAGCLFLDKDDDDASKGGEAKGDTSCVSSANEAEQPTGSADSMEADHA